MIFLTSRTSAETDRPTTPDRMTKLRGILLNSSSLGTTWVFFDLYYTMSLQRLSVSLPQPYLSLCHFFSVKVKLKI